MSRWRRSPLRESPSSGLVSKTRTLDRQPQSQSSDSHRAFVVAGNTWVLEFQYPHSLGWDLYSVMSEDYVISWPKRFSLSQGPTKRILAFIISVRGPLRHRSSRVIVSIFFFFFFFGDNLLCKWKFNLPIHWFFTFRAIRKPPHWAEADSKFL